MSFYLGFEEKLAIVTNLQAGAPLSYDAERLSAVLSESKDRDLQKREPWRPPRSWAFFKISIAATYLYLVRYIEPRGYFGHDVSSGSPLAESGAGTKPRYSRPTERLTARIARGMQPQWLDDVTARHVRSACEWLVSPPTGTK